MVDTVLTSAARIGVFGGTFDPIHFGHLAIAEEARWRYALDAVLFIPAGDPPHKAGLGADAESRYLMTVLATADHPSFYVSRCELERDGPSYTVDTLRSLHAAYPAAQLFLLMGLDAALDFPGWREPETIRQMATVIAAERPGYSSANVSALRNAGIDIFPAPGLLLSSSALRERLAGGKSLRYLVPDPVARYLDKCQCYRVAH